jgi:hypothetical protein
VTYVQDLTCRSKDAACLVLGGPRLSETCQGNGEIEPCRQQIRVPFPEPVPLDSYDGPEFLYGFVESVLRAPDLSGFINEPQFSSVVIS